MDFDERILTADHIRQAIDAYRTETWNHRPARSAFLLHEEEELPAKFILRLAFRAATGHLPRPETLTGGRASVRVLRNLGFDAVYIKKPSGNRNLIKNARREAFKNLLEKRWGRVERECKFLRICVPDLGNRGGMEGSVLRVLEAVEAHRSISVRGRKNLSLRFDYFLPEQKLVVEFDERQHFSPLRAASLCAYPDGVLLGFDKERWIRLSEEIRAGDNSPIYRDEQRAFYDALRDLGVERAGLRPVVRIFEEDVAWEKDGAASSPEAKTILDRIEEIVGQKRS